MSSIVSYRKLISPPRLFDAWEEFRKGKMNKSDVQAFGRNLENNLFTIHEQLLTKTWCHGTYESFWVTDPKRRHIHKAMVGDRVVHHVLYTYLYELFDRSFFYDSYSCRIGKGTHKAVERLASFVRKESKNYTRDCWVLHCDIEKYFASVDHAVLKSLLTKKIQDADVFWLIREVIDSFHSDKGHGKGIPLGNVTSQVFANVYLHELDMFVKHTLKIRYYVRYADDFVLASADKSELERTIEPMREFLVQKLSLTPHPTKISIRRLSWGIDFLGYIILPHYRLPRTKTKHRMFERIYRNIFKSNSHQMIQSYLGYLSHADTHELQKEIFTLVDKCRDS